MADGGGRVVAALKVLRGPDRIGRLYYCIARYFPGLSYRRIRAQNLFVVGASVYPHNAGYNPHRAARRARAAAG
jgi:hypothetical protein